MQHEILLGLTTTPKSDWRGKVEEMKKFGIKKIALFPTFLETEQRNELYSLLEEIEGLEIPHVHLRSDMAMDELQYFIDKFDSKIFNIHPDNSRYIFSDDFLKFSSYIYVENLIIIPTVEELKKYSGICIDFSHWENNVRLGINDWNDPQEKYNDAMLKRLKIFSVGCCHVSPVQDDPYTDTDFPTGFQYDKHSFDDLKEFDYLLKYKQYFPKYLSLELENSFEEQLEAKEYLKKLLQI